MYRRLHEHPLGTLRSRERFAARKARGKAAAGTADDFFIAPANNRE